MNRYADPSMNRLADSLGATGVLSDGYRKNIEGWALAAIGEGYHRGVATGEQRAAKALLSKVAALRQNATDPARNTYTVVIGQLYQLELIDAAEWRAALDLPRLR